MPTQLEHKVLKQINFQFIQERNLQLALVDILYKIKHKLRLITFKVFKKLSQGLDLVKDHRFLIPSSNVLLLKFHLMKNKLA